MSFSFAESSFGEWCFSNVNAHTNHRETLLKPEGLGFCISVQLPGDAPRASWVLNNTLYSEAHGHKNKAVVTFSKKSVVILHLTMFPSMTDCICNSFPIRL